MRGAPATVNIFGFRVKNTSLRGAAEAILDRSEKGLRENIFFVNAHCVNIAAKNPAYRKILSRADCVFADGVGIALASIVAGQALRDNINGTDLFPVLCDIAAQRKIPIALLGARPDIVQRCADRMTSRYPGLNIVCALDGYFGPEKDDEVIAKINASGAKVLLVARGVPIQETWIDQLGHRIEVPQVMAVGGLFDFYSGHVRRAPLVMRRLGLEWLVRLAQEPRRLFRRYVIGNPVFLYRTFRLRIQGRSNLRNRLS